MKCTSSAIVSGKFTAFAKRFNKWTWKRILIFLFPMRITVKCYKAAQQINGRWSGIGLIISVIKMLGLPGLIDRYIQYIS